MGMYLQPWTNQDERYVLENYGTMGPQVIADDLDRTYYAVIAKMSELRLRHGLPRRAPAIRGAMNWTAEQDAALLNSDRSAIALADELGRTPAAVRQRRMRLRKGRVRSWA